MEGEKKKVTQSLQELFCHMADMQRKLEQLKQNQRDRIDRAAYAKRMEARAESEDEAPTKPITERPASPEPEAKGEKPSPVGLAAREANSRPSSSSSESSAEHMPAEETEMTTGSSRSMASIPSNEVLVLVEETDSAASSNSTSSSANVSRAGLGRSLDPEIVELDEKLQRLRTRWRWCIEEEARLGVKFARLANSGRPGAIELQRAWGTQCTPSPLGGEANAWSLGMARRKPSAAKLPAQLEAQQRVAAYRQASEEKKFPYQQIGRISPIQMQKKKSQELENIKIWQTNSSTKRRANLEMKKCPVCGRVGVRNSSKCPDFSEHWKYKM